MPKEVFITGSEGFAGTHLKQELLQHGYTVSGTTLKPDNVEDENIFQCDIRDQNRVHQLISESRPEYIVHLAAFVSPSASIENPELTNDINFNGTKNLFESVRLVAAEVNNYNPRILLIGSIEEFGKPSDGTTITETSPTNPLNPYAQTKLKTYELALDYISNYGLDIVSAIPSNHTGPGQQQFFAAEVASQIAKIEKGSGEPVLTTGNVSNSKNFSDVRDIVRAYRLLLEFGETGERYLVCNDKNTPLSYIVDTLLGYAKVKIIHKIDLLRGRGDQAEIYFDNTKLKTTTGYQPNYTIEETLLDLLNSHRIKE